MIANNRISGMNLLPLSLLLTFSLVLSRFSPHSLRSSIWCAVNMKNEILNALSANLLFLYCCCVPVILSAQTNKKKCLPLFYLFCLGWRPFFFGCVSFIIFIWMNYLSIKSNRSKSFREKSARHSEKM